VIKLPVKLPTSIPSIGLHDLDITGWDLTRLDPRPVLRRVDIVGTITGSPVTKLAGRTLDQARDVALTAVGFAVLAGQKAQVRRRELFEAIAARRDQNSGDAHDTAGSPQPTA
jgi:hypothetical protein